MKRDTVSIVEEEDGTSSGDGQKSNNNNLSSTHEVSILGTHAKDVKAALESIKAIIADNELVEKCIELPCSYVTPLLGTLPKGGLRDIEKTVKFIRLWIKDDEGESGGAIWCSGPKCKVSEAIPLVYTAAKLAQSLTEEVNVPLHIMGAIIGKRGSMINSIREAHPAVHIMLDLVGYRVLFHSADEPARKEARFALMKLISDNQVDTVQLGSDVATLLKSKPATNTRSAINALDVHMNVLGDTVGTIRLKGKAEAIQEAIKILLEFMSTNQLEIIQIEPEDLSSFPMVFTELRQNVGIINAQLYKDKLELHLRGTPEQLAEARSCVHNVLHGVDKGGGSIAFVPFEPEIIGLIIGKGGRQIIKMQEEYRVSMEVISPKGKPRVRIRGDPKMVAEAKAKITVFVENTSITTTVDIASMYNGSEIPPFTHSDMLHHCETVKNVFKIAANPDQEGKCIQLRGMSRKIVAARPWLLALLTGRASKILPISGALNAEEAAFAVERLNAELNNAGQSSGAVMVKIIPNDGVVSIAIEGEPSIVQEAVGKAYKILEGLFQGRFASVCVVIGALDLSIGTPRAIRTAVEVGEGEVEIFADWTLHCVHIRGKNADCVSAAVGYLDTVAKAWMVSNTIVTFEKWMAPLIIGKHGAAINDFSEKHSVVIRVDQNALTCFISNRKSQRKAFTTDSRRTSPRRMDSNEDGRGGPNGSGGGGNNNVIQAAHALRRITDKMYKTNGCPLPDPQAIFSREKGKEALKMVESKTGASCTCTQANTVLICGDKASVLEARTALKEIMENGLEEEGEQQHDGERIKSADVDLPSPHPSSLLSKGDGDVPVTVTSPPPSSAARELPVAPAMVRLEHRVADVVGNFWAAEGSGGIATSSHPKAADNVSPSCRNLDFHYQTEKVPPCDAVVVMDAQYSAPEKQKQGSEHVPSILFGETAKRQQLSMNAVVSKNGLPDESSSSLPDRSNSAVQGSKKMGGKNGSEKPAALYEEKGSWYFGSLSGLRVRLT